MVTNKNMALKLDLLTTLISEYKQFNYLFTLYPRSTTGDPSFTSASSAIVYDTLTYKAGIYANQGQEGLLLILQDALKDYMLTAEDINTLSNNVETLLNVHTNLAPIYATDAEQNVSLWELEAQVIQGKEQMSGWQGDGFFENQDEVESFNNMVVTRGMKKGEGFASFGTPNFDKLVKVANPDVMPTNKVNSVGFSPDGIYLAVGLNFAPYLTIYKKDETIYNKLIENTLNVPSTLVKDVKFSSDGIYLAVGIAIAPYLILYKRDGDIFTKLNPPLVLPSGPVNDASFSSDGIYLALAISSSPYVNIYKRSGDVFAKLSNVTGGNPTSTGNGVSLSDDGTYLMVAHSNSPCVSIYKRTGDIYAKIANPDILPTGYGQDADYSNPYLAIVHLTSPYITIYKRNGDSFVKLPNPEQLPTGNANGVSFSPDGIYLNISHIAFPYMTQYKINNDIFTKIDNQPYLPTGVCNTSSYSSQSANLAIASDLTPFLIIYDGKGVVTTPTTGDLTLKPTTLSVVGNSVFILDDAVLDTGVNRTYDVSLNGGATWESIITTGETVVLNHSGNQLIVKLKFTRISPGIGNGKVNWVMAWAGVN